MSDFDQIDAFVAAIAETPDDDTPRLVFADWLDEKGRHARAEFIRVQCELACLPADAPRRPELVERERQLLKEWGERWASPLYQLAGEWNYRRGFIEQVEIKPPCCIACHLLKDLRQFAPIRHIRFYEFVDLGSLAENVQYLAGLEVLEILAFDVNNRKDRLALRQILTSPHLAGLRELRIMGAGIGGGEIDGKTFELTVNSPYLKDLRALSLYEYLEGMWEDHVRALARSPHLPSLTDLDLRFVSLKVSGWRALLRSPHRANLRQLRLHQASCTGDFPQKESLRQALEARFGADALDWDSEFTCWTGLKWTERPFMSDHGY